MILQCPETVDSDSVSEKQTGLFKTYSYKWIQKRLHVLHMLQARTKKNHVPGPCHVVFTAVHKLSQLPNQLTRFVIKC